MCVCKLPQVTNVSHLLQRAAPARILHQGETSRETPQSHHLRQRLWYALRYKELQQQRKKEELFHLFIKGEINNNTNNNKNYIKFSV